MALLRALLRPHDSLLVNVPCSLSEIWFGANWWRCIHIDYDLCIYELTGTATLLLEGLWVLTFSWVSWSMWRPGESRSHWTDVYIHHELLDLELDARPQLTSSRKFFLHPEDRCPSFSGNHMYSYTTSTFYTSNAVCSPTQDFVEWVNTTRFGDGLDRSGFARGPFTLTKDPSFDYELNWAHVLYSTYESEVVGVVPSSQSIEPFTCWNPVCRPLLVTGTTRNRMPFTSTSPLQWMTSNLNFFSFVLYFLTTTHYVLAFLRY